MGLTKKWKQQNAAVVDENGNGVCMCHMGAHVDFKQMTENVKLIAAAPDMLEELKSVAALMLSNSRGHEVDYKLIYESVDKVIKKATE